MSSMWRAAVILPVLLLTAPSSSAQYPATYAVAPAYSAPSVASSIADWRRLRQSSGYSFADYARFLIANPGWPDEARLRRWAEGAMQPGENSATVIAFFAKDKPSTGGGWARLADAYAANGRMPDALDAARNAWASDDLSGTDEQSIWARYGGSFTTADHDRRIDSLLFAKRADDAARFYAMATPARQAGFAARIAMQRRAPDAENLYQAEAATVTSDAGLMMDRARYLRDQGYDRAARDLAARQLAFVYRPADPGRFYDMLWTLASGAAQDGDWNTAFNIARHLSDAIPEGQTIAQQPIGTRDNYTSLVWLAGMNALDRTGRPGRGIPQLDAYARAGRSLQVQTKGNYWAGRAALAAGQFQLANSYFQAAAQYPELFYGQLALERLGRSVTPPQQSVAATTATPAQRAAFNNKRLVQAVRILGQQGQSTEQALFVR